MMIDAYMYRVSPLFRMSHRCHHLMNLRCASRGFVCDWQITTFPPMNAVTNLMKTYVPRASKSRYDNEDGRVKAKNRITFQTELPNDWTNCIILKLFPISWRDSRSVHFKYFFQNFIKVSRTKILSVLIFTKYQALTPCR